MRVCGSEPLVMFETNEEKNVRERTQDIKKHMGIWS